MLHTTTLFACRSVFPLLPRSDPHETDDTTTLVTGGAGGGGAGGMGGTGGWGGGGAAKTRIAFGSCVHQGAAKPVLDLAGGELAPSLASMGDNIDGDTTDMAVLQGKYYQPADSPEFHNLCAKAPLIAT